MKKYKLINTKTNQEYICQKLSLDDFEYYLGDTKSKRGWFYCLRTKRLFQDEGVDVNCCMSDLNVVATTNPNIDAPKVVDEAEIQCEILTYKDYKHLCVRGYNKAKETYNFTEKDMIEFGKFCHDKKYERSFDEKVVLIQDKVSLVYTEKELLQLWLEQKIETIYFNS